MRLGKTKMQNNSKTEVCIKLKFKKRIVTPSSCSSTTEGIHHSMGTEILSHFFLSLATVYGSFNMVNLSERLDLCP